MPAYPPVEPYDSGSLEVGDGHALHWEICGNEGGQPAVVLHGGPGSGCTPGHRRLFDPARYRVVLVDQRGCGRSRPHAGDSTLGLAANTTHHLLSDLEALRVALGIERWLVLGSSWGSTLALAYAEAHRDRVSHLVLAAVTTSRRSEIDWLYHGARRFFPEAWDRFRAGAPSAEDGDLVGAYRLLLQSPDPAVHEQAAREWCRWEEAVVGGPGPDPRSADRRFRLAFARIVTHYFHHGCWLVEGQLLREAHRLEGIPGVLVHGGLDLSSPLLTAYELARAWPGSELVVVDAGHRVSDPSLTAAVVAATDRFAR